MTGIAQFIKSEYGIDEVRTLSFSERWRLYQRITWDLKLMELDYEVYRQAEKDVSDFLEL